jgi:hypothetical protein
MSGELWSQSRTDETTDAITLSAAKASMKSEGVVPGRSVYSSAFLFVVVSERRRGE